ncbi:DNA replication/repair protein RecF [Rickettsiaceae bacterium]|nr:DNA replication/repair protein RecF [Rickettsiaceae bacterium]
MTFQIKEVYLRDVVLQDYRNFSDVHLEFSSGVNVIVGSNGSGKTNILESISFLSPGKGLKSSNFDIICKYGMTSWKSRFTAKSKVGVSEIESSFNIAQKSRGIKYNGSKISSNALLDLLNVVWLTPQMEGLFLDSTSVRRRFLDRIVYNFDVRHAKHITSYEHFMRERNKILAQGNVMSESAYLSTIEERMATDAENIENARHKTITLMQGVIDSLDTEFPKANLDLTKLSEEQDNWDDFTKEYASILKENRQKDSYSGRTNFGVHKADLLISYREKGCLAKICSTGEQKALLISVILSSIEFIKQNTGAAPILLLDELFVHLDIERKNQLIEYIISTKLQTFITTADIVDVGKLGSIAHIINL